MSSLAVSPGGPKLSAWLLAPSRSLPAIESRLQDVITVGRRFETLDDLLKAGQAVAPPLVVVSVDWPDQLTATDIACLMAGFPSSRLVCVTSPWCAAMNRTRGTWPASVVTSLDELPDRITLEREIIAGHLPPVPPTAGREELIIFDFAEPCPETATAVAMHFCGADSHLAATVTEALRPHGVTVGAGDFRNPDAAILVDGDPWTDEKLEAVRSASRAVVLTSDLDVASHPAATDGCTTVSKFASPAIWAQKLRAGVALVLLLLVGGCAEGPKPQEARQEAAQPGWEDQVNAVRRGESNRIVFEGDIGQNDWNALATGCESLEVLELVLSPTGEVNLGVLTRLPKLRRLKITGTIGDAGAASLAKCPTLAELNLPAAGITDAGFQSLCGLPLKQLRLRAPKVTDEGLKSLAGLKTLRFLHLIDVPISDASLPVLEQLPSLESLYLDGGRCSDDGLGRLLQTRPELHFHRDQMHLPSDPNADAH